MKLHNKPYIDISVKDALNLNFKMNISWLEIFTKKLTYLKGKHPQEVYIEITYDGGESLNTIVYRGVKPVLSSKDEIKIFVENVNEKLTKLQLKKENKYKKWLTKREEYQSLDYCKSLKSIF